MTVYTIRRRYRSRHFINTRWGLDWPGLKRLLSLAFGIFNGYTIDSTYICTVTLPYFVVGHSKFVTEIRVCRRHLTRLVLKTLHTRARNETYVAGITRLNNQCSVTGGRYSCLHLNFGFWMVTRKQCGTSCAVWRNLSLYVAFTQIGDSLGCYMFAFVRRVYNNKQNKERNTNHSGDCMTSICKRQPCGRLWTTFQVSLSINCNTHHHRRYSHRNERRFHQQKIKTSLYISITLSSV
jgi:hypothetical protein